MNTNIKKFLAIAALSAVSAVAFAQLQPTRRPGLLRSGGGLRRPGAAAAAQPAPEAKPISEQLKEIPKGTNGVPMLNFENAPLELVLMQYASLSEKVLLPAPNLPKTQITLTSNGLELDKESYLLAIEAALVMNGVVIEPFDKHFLRAFERKSVRTQGIRTLMNVSTNGIPEKGRVISQLIRLDHITAAEAQEALKGFMDEKGQFQVFERNNAILVTDTQENVNRMLEIIKELDVPNPVLEEVYVHEVKFAVASEIKARLEEIVTASEKDTQKAAASVKSSGGPGFSRPTAPPQPNRLLNLNNRPGMNKPEQPVNTPNAVLTAAISDADRGMIRGKVLIVADDRSNKLIVITSKTNWNFFKRIIESLDVETEPDETVKVHQLKHAEAEEVASMLNDLIGSSTSQSKNNQNANANRAGAATRNLTQGARPGVTPPRPTSSAANSNLGALNKDTVKILADKRLNAIVVKARKEDMNLILHVIEDMDIKLSQVLLETVIIQVELGDDLQTGVDWVQRGKRRGYAQATDKLGNKLFYMTDENGNRTDYTGVAGATRTFTDTDGLEHTYTASSLFPVINKKTFRDGLYNNGSYMLGGGGGSGTSMLGSLLTGKNGSSGSSNTSASENDETAATANAVTDGALLAANPIAGGVNYLLKSDKLNIASIIQAAKSDSRSKVLASPVLMTLDNKEATIEATDMIYLFSGYQYSGSTYSGTQVRNYEKRDIGLTVKVTPHINKNGTVMLKIEEKFETQGADQNVPNESGGTDPYATVTTRKVSSEVTVENLQTIMMGGLTRKSNVQSVSGIPLLKDIPWIGKWLFGSVSIKEARSELLVFITPYVLDDAAASQAEALRRKKVLSTTRPWDDNGWSLSALADPVTKKEQLRRQALEWAEQDEEHATGKKLEEAKEKRIKDIEEKTEKERREWAEKHQKDVLEAIKRHEESDVDWREFIDKLRKEKEEKDAAKAQDERSAAKVREAAGEEPAKAPEPAKENLLEALQKK